jgi:ComF family protein
MSDLTVAVQFDSVFQEIMHHIKYNKMGKLALAISKYCWHFFQDELTLEGNELVIPVPLHPVREKERGFNQSYLIAKGLFDNHNLPIRTDLIHRKKNTPSQTTLNRQERIENVYEAFEIRQREYIKDQKIILVDDVATTGATLNECARLLMIAGASRIMCVALATPVNENLNMDQTFNWSDKALRLKK